jgi:hypothetical protein
MNRIASQNTHAELDLELVVQRVLKLAEIAMLEHLESLERSQLASLADPSDLAATPEL